MKEDRPVEDDETEDERARDAHPEALEVPAERERAREEDELAERDREMPRGALPVQLLQDLVRHGGREPLPQISDRAVVVPGLHPAEEITPAGTRRLLSGALKRRSVLFAAPRPPTSSATR